MTMQNELKRNAKKFVERWSAPEHGSEKSECQKFWYDLLVNVFGVDCVEFLSYIKFEKDVKEYQEDKTVTDFIDGYIPSTKVLVEQKTRRVNLLKSARQSDQAKLTPYDQARKYASRMPLSERPRWIVTCNFDEFLIYDEEHPGKPEKILLKDLANEISRLNFLVDSRSDRVRREEEVNLKAGELIGDLYKALRSQYRDPDENSLRSLNILCVRIVFCLYAEDAGLFGAKTAFDDYIKSFRPENARDGIIKLFKVLDTKPSDRDKYDEKTSAFPYVNGGLFADEEIEIPQFTKEIISLIADKCGDFDWSGISPVIFGALFESTLNPQTQKEGGMHYTSVENIHKVIDPLFLDDLKAEFRSICKNSKGNERNKNLWRFQQKIGALKFLDPACGSGNFLTETYTCLRDLENECFKLRLGKNVGTLAVFGKEYEPQVSIDNFYGIEINDFAVAVAKTALWIAENQMMEKTEEIQARPIKFLPLKNHATIVEGNALRTNWATLKPVEGWNNRGPEINLFSEFLKQPEGGKHVYDYIIGNPPFSGARKMKAKDSKKDDEKLQKDDMVIVFGEKWPRVGNLDYVAAWYKKAVDFIDAEGCSERTKVALVSTNSICQGESVNNLWKPLFANGLEIDFAWRTFRWDSEALRKAQVHCVIVGFHCGRLDDKPKAIFDKGERINAAHINGYLLDMPDMWIGNRETPLCDVPEVGIGNKPVDGGNYLFDEPEKEEFVKKEPASAKYFHPWYGAKEFTHNEKRYCLWLGDCPATELLKMPACKKRVEKARDFRLNSTASSTRKLAEKPTRFHVENFPDIDYLFIPQTSSENYVYVPMGFMPPAVLSSNAARIVPGATMYHFGVLTSKVHMIWMRTVTGRMKSDYQYAAEIVYNNFPWPKTKSTQEITATAQAILDSRAKYPDATLNQMYGKDMYLFPELVKAHNANDKAVMEAYGFKESMTDAEILYRLFEMYKELTLEKPKSRK